MHTAPAGASSQTVTTVVSGPQEAQATRQSSFLAGHTASGPLNVPGRLVSEASSYPSNYANMSASGATTTQHYHQTSEDAYYQGMQVLGEQVIEHEMTVPTRRLVEEIVEKVVVVPEKVQREELCEEKRVVRERIVQVAQPVEKKVYVDDIQVVDREKLVEVPSVVQADNVIYKEVWRQQEVVKEVPKYVEREVPVEYEVLEYKHVPVEKVVEVEEKKIIEKVVERPVTRYVEVEVPVYREVEKINEVHRHVPAPTEVVTTQEFALPKLEAEYEEIPLPVFVPSFTEVPLPAEYLTDSTRLQMQQMRQNIALAASHAQPSLCVIEDLGQQVRSFQPQIISDPNLLSQRIAGKLNQ